MTTSAAIQLIDAYNARPEASAPETPTAPPATEPVQAVTSPITVAPTPSTSPPRFGGNVPQRLIATETATGLPIDSGVLDAAGTGRAVLYTRTAGVRRLVVVDPTVGLEPILDLGTGATDAVISHNGRFVLAFFEATAELKRFDLQTGAQTVLASTEWAGLFAGGISNDGERSLLGINGDIYLRSAMTSTLIPSPALGARRWSGLLSPDGTFAIINTAEALSSDDNNGFTEAYIVGLTSPSPTRVRLADGRDVLATGFTPSGKVRFGISNGSGVGTIDADGVIRSARVVDQSGTVTTIGDPSGDDFRITTSVVGQSPGRYSYNADGSVTQITDIFGCDVYEDFDTAAGLICSPFRDWVANRLIPNLLSHGDNTTVAVRYQI